MKIPKQVEVTIGMGNILIRREFPFPPGLNTGFVTGCFHIAIDAFFSEYRSAELQELGDLSWEVSISLVGDNEIRDVNRRFRNIDEATDVLSFPQYEPEEIREFLESYSSIQKLLLGDVVISLEHVDRAGNGDPEISRRSFAWMVVHGVLHLTGFNHETKEDEIRMRKEEGRILLEMEEFISGISS